MDGLEHHRSGTSEQGLPKSHHFWGQKMCRHSRCEIWSVLNSAVATAVALVKRSCRHSWEQSKTLMLQTSMDPATILCSNFSPFSLVTQLVAWSASHCGMLLDKNIVLLHHESYYVKRAHLWILNPVGWIYKFKWVDCLLMVQSRFCPDPQISSRGSLNWASSPAVVKGSSPRLLLMLRWTCVHQA